MAKVKAIIFLPVCVRSKETSVGHVHLCHITWNTCRCFGRRLWWR